jgi:hypothetical protein
MLVTLMITPQISPQTCKFFFQKVENLIVISEPLAVSHCTFPSTMSHQSATELIALQIITTHEFPFKCYFNIFIYYINLVHDSAWKPHCGIKVLTNLLLDIDS